MQPDWMIDIPDELGSDWYVMPRPEGQRCILVAAYGATISRLRSGIQLHRFQSALPGGSRHTRSGGEDFTILDVVYSPQTDTYYLMDIMCWKGCSYYDCSAEFRLFWLHSKWAELSCDAARVEQEHCMEPVPAYQCGSGGLRSAYTGAVPYPRDGLYLLHKEGHYALGPSPLALLWKDPCCSRYFIDTDQQGVTLPHQLVVLEYRMDCTLATGDTPPLVLARLPPSFAQEQGDRLKPGKLLRFAVEAAGIQMEDGRPTGAALRFEGSAQQRRGRADAWSKIAFQYFARRVPLAFQELEAAVSGGAMDVLLGSESNDLTHDILKS